MTEDALPCPCGSGTRFDDCCEPYLKGKRDPPTAVALMRSRYTAYTLGNEAYLLHTWHPESRPAALNLARNAHPWLGLSILGHSGGGADEHEGQVEFQARYQEDGTEYTLHETSRFLRLAMRWHYVDGKVKTTARKPSRPGRNDPCPCGSGKKFKKCCGD